MKQTSLLISIALIFLAACAPPVAPTFTPEPPPTSTLSPTLTPQPTAKPTEIVIEASKTPELPTATAEEQWVALLGSDKLINHFGWNGVRGVKLLQNEIEVSGLGGTDLNIAVNRGIQIVDIKGDFSIKANIAAQEGMGGGLAIVSEDGKELNVIINRPLKGAPFTKPSSGGELLIKYRDGSKDSATLLSETSFPPKINGEDVVEVKFRPGADQTVVNVNGRELKPVIAKGMLANSKLFPAVIAGSNAKIIVSDLSINAPSNKNAKLLEVPKPTVAVALLPQSTPIPPTATVATQTPHLLLTPFVYGERTLIPVSSGPCVDPVMKGVWLRNENSGVETCFTGFKRNPALDAAVESWFNGAKQYGAGNYSANIAVVGSILDSGEVTGGVLSITQFPYSELESRLNALPAGTKKVYHYLRNKGSAYPNAIMVSVDLP